jgi:hypothetical protein
MAAAATDEPLIFCERVERCGAALFALQHVSARERATVIKAVHDFFGGIAENFGGLFET